MIYLSFNNTMKIYGLFNFNFYSNFYMSADSYYTRQCNITDKLHVAIHIMHLFRVYVLYVIRILWVFINCFYHFINKMCVHSLFHHFAKPCVDVQICHTLLINHNLLH